MNRLQSFPVSPGKLTDPFFFNNPLNFYRTNLYLPTMGLKMKMKIKNIFLYITVSLTLPK